MTDTNPLLDFDPKPAFDRMCAEHVAPAVQTLLAEADAALERAVGTEVPVDYEALSAVTEWRRPTAATRMSAWRVCCPGRLARRGQRVSRQSVQPVL
ncbi:MAG: hypothetical protein ACKOD9_17040, partial [Rubrivivax sp.]